MNRELTNSHTEAVLAFDRVCFSYDGRPGEILRNVSFALAPKTFTAIVGPSGSGKTTLLTLAAGLAVPERGAVSRKGKVRMVFQTGGLLPWRTVRENVHLGFRGIALSHRERERELSATLADLGIGDLAHAYPRDLSGGQRQRVGIARALVSRPDLLLLDEPFSALDAETTAHLRGIVERLHEEKGVAMLMVSHSIEDAVMLADRVLVVAGGGIKHDTSVLAPRPRDPDVVRPTIERIRALLPSA